MYWCNKMYVLHVFNFEFLIFFFICVAMYLGVAFLWGVVCGDSFDWGMVCDRGWLLWNTFVVF